MEFVKADKTFITLKITKSGYPSPSISHLIVFFHLKVLEILYRRY